MFFKRKTKVAKTATFYKYRRRKTIKYVVKYIF